MAEKNTLSILETIKKKMHKLDSKSENVSKISNIDDEFQYISSGNKSDATKAEEENLKINNFEDNLPKIEQDLSPPLPKIVDNAPEENSNFAQIVKSVEDQPLKARVSEEIKKTDSFDDFNLDDLDIDNEEKFSQTTVEKTAVLGADKKVDQAELNGLSKEPERKIAEEGSEAELLVDEDLEDYEDEVEFAEENLEEQHLESSLESSLENDVDKDLQPKEELLIDQKVINAEVEENAEKTESDFLNFDEKNQNENDQQEMPQQNSENVLEVVKDLPEISQEKTDDLSVEELLFGEEKGEEVLAQEQLDESDKINFDFNEKLPEKNGEQEEVEALEIAEKEVAEIAEKKIDELNFADLEKDVKENEIEEFLGNEENSEPKEQSINLQNQQPKLSSQNSENKIFKDEIDLEFEKEIMGFRSEATKSEVVKLQLQDSKQNTLQQSQTIHSSSNSVYDLNQPSVGLKSQAYQATVRQVNDSVKKLIDAKNLVSGVSNFTQDPALVGLAVQLMEPKLEKWLNENLPNLVETVVREEIKKIIPKE